MTVEKDFPVAATCVLRKWYFPLRADRQDMSAALPLLSPLRWKGMDSSGGRPTRTTRRTSPLLALSPRRWKREGCQDASTRTHAASFPRLTISGKGMQAYDSAATGKTFGTSQEGVSQWSAAVLCDSVVQVLLVTPVVWMCVRLTGGGS